MVTTLKKTNKKGFTLVELVIVIAILAILAAIAIPTVTNVIGSANESVDKTSAQTVEVSLKAAYAEAAAGTWKDKVPDTITVSEALVREGISELPEPKVKGSKYRSRNGKISLSSESSDGEIFDKDSTVKSVLDNKDKGKK